jgi:hypothetical protein
MAQKPQSPEDLPPIEIDFSIDETMEIVAITDDTATPVPNAATGIRPVSSRPATSPVPTAPLGTKKLKVAAEERNSDELDADDLVLMEAIRHSLEKSAHVLRAVAHLCVEKRVFAPGDLRDLNPRSPGTRAR